MNVEEKKAAEILAIADMIERNQRCTPVGHGARVEAIHSTTCDCGLVKRLRALVESEKEKDT